MIATIICSGTTRSLWWVSPRVTSAFAATTTLRNFKQTVRYNYKYANTQILIRKYKYTTMLRNFWKTVRCAASGGDVDGDWRGSDFFYTFTDFFKKCDIPFQWWRSLPQQLHFARYNAGPSNT